MAECQRESELHAHTAGKRFNLLRRLEPKAFEPALEILVAPLAVSGRDDALHFVEAELVVETAVVKNDADAVLDGTGVCGHIQVKDAHFAAVLVDEVEDGMQGRRFASAVGANEAGDAAFRQRKGEILQGEAIVSFGQIVYSE